MADLLTMSIEAVLTNTNATQKFWTWPFESSDTAQTGHEFTAAPDEHKFLSVDAPTTPGETIDTADLTTVSYLLVYNTDGANFITVTRVNAAAATVVDKVLAGQCVVITDVDPATDPILIGDTGTCVCLVAVVGT